MAVFSGVEIQAVGVQGAAASNESGNQFGPTVTALPDGRFLLSWVDEGSNSIGARIVDPSGRPLGAAFTIDVPAGFSPTDMTELSVAPDGTVWIASVMVNDTTGLNTLSCTSFTPSGSDSAPTWFLLDASSQGHQIFPSIELRSDGRAVVSWIEVPTGLDPSDIQTVLSGNVRASILSSPSSTVTGVFAVNNLQIGAGLFGTDIVVNADGSFLITWDGGAVNSTSDETDVMGQRFNANGTKIGGPFVINSEIAGLQYDSQTVRLSDGNIAVVWQSGNAAGGDMVDVVGRILAPDGSFLTDAFIIHEEVAGNQRDVAIAALSQGRFIVTWADESGLVADPGTGVLGRIFDRFGTPLGPSIAVNSTIPGVQDASSIAVIGDRVIVGWQDLFATGASTTGFDIDYQVFDVTPQHVSLTLTVPAASGFQPTSIVTGTSVTSNGDLLVTRLQGLDVFVDRYSAGDFSKPAETASLGLLAQDFFTSYVENANLKLLESPQGFYLTWVEWFAPDKWTSALYSKASSVTTFSLLSADDFGPIQPGLPAGNAYPSAHSNRTVLLDGSQAYGQFFDAPEVGVGHHWLVAGIFPAQGGNRSVSIDTLALGLAERDERTVLDSARLSDGRIAYQVTSGQLALELIILDPVGGAHVGLELPPATGPGSEWLTELVATPSNTIILFSMDYTNSGWNKTAHLYQQEFTLEGTPVGSRLHIRDFFTSIFSGPPAVWVELIDGGYVITSVDDSINGTFDAVPGDVGVDVMLFSPDRTGGTAADQIDGDARSQSLNGLAGNDVLRGLGGHDTLLGGANDDRLLGGIGFDNLFGGNGADRLDGGANEDIMSGGLGNDVYVVNAVGDSVRGESATSAGGGQDTVISAVSFRLGVNLESLTLSGTAASNGFGNTLANRLQGNAAANILAGGLGRDTLTGGLGADSFVFNTALASGNIDVITDFNRIADTIRLDDAVFAALPRGILAAGAFRSDPSGLATTASHRIIYESDNGRLYYDADGSGGIARVQFATLSIGLTLTASDFLIV